MNVSLINSDKNEKCIIRNKKKTARHLAGLVTSHQHHGWVVGLVEEAALDADQGAPQHTAFRRGDPRHLCRARNKLRLIRWTSDGSPQFVLL